MRYTTFGSTLKAFGDPRPVVVKPPSMLSKNNPNGLPWRRASSRSWFISCSRDTVLLDSTCRFDWRDTGRNPGSALPCPFDLRKALQRRAIEQERLQHAFVDDRDALGLHALIVVEVVPHQLDVADFLHASDRTSTLRNAGSTGCPTLLVNVCPSSALRWRLPSTRWPKISWKNTPAARPDRIAGPENGSTSGAFRSRASRSTIARASATSWRLVGQSIGRRREVARVERQLHAVFRFGHALNEDAAADVAGDDLRAFAVDVVPVVGLDGQRHLAAQHERVFAEDRRHAAQPRFPRLRVERIG